MKSSARRLIRVAVLESDPVRFLGLRMALASEPDIQIRAATVEAVLNSRHDELVLLTADRGLSFHAAMSALKAVRPAIRIVVTGPGRQEEDILRVVSAGAKGYVSEEASPAEFRKAIREVHNGSVWVPRRVMAAFIERATAYTRRLPSRGELKISEREREVLRLLVAGYSNREIARQLGILEGTVKAHVAQLMRKIGVPNRIALSVHALTHSLLSPSSTTLDER